MTRNPPQYFSNYGSSRHPEQLLPVPNSTKSYWRSSLHPLDEHRSTAELPQGCDILIIGAGMSGVVLAYQLLKECGDGPIPSILLLEARQVCSGATGRNGVYMFKQQAMLSGPLLITSLLLKGHSKAMTWNVLKMKRNHGVEYAERTAQFYNDTTYVMKDIVDAEQLECEFELRRSFDIMLDEAQARAAEEEYRESVRNREIWTRQVDFVPKERVEQVTSIKGAKAAFSVPACSLWPYKFVTGLLARIIDRINLQTNTPVTEVHVDDSGVNIARTSRGLIRAKKVVFASNAYTGGICPVYGGKIVPYKGSASHLKPHPKPVSPHLSYTYNIGYAPDRVDYLNPRPDGSIVVGGGQWNYNQDRKVWLNNWDDSTLLPNVRSYFDGLMQRNFRGWEESGSSLDGLWTGIMCLTADGFPHVGRVIGQQNQYIMAGFNGGGMSVIATTAIGLAKMVMHGISFAETGLPEHLETSEKRLKEEFESSVSHGAQSRA